MLSPNGKLVEFIVKEAKAHVTNERYDDALKYTTFLLEKEEYRSILDEKQVFDLYFIQCVCHRRFGKFDKACLLLERAIQVYVPPAMTNDIIATVRLWLEIKEGLNKTGS